LVVIDAHVHFGEKCEIFGFGVTEDVLIGTMNKVGIDKAIVQNPGGIPDAIKGHDDIAALAKKYPGRIYGICSINPIKYGIDKTLAEMERTARKLNFRGVKIHTLAWCLTPSNPFSTEMIEKARNLGIAVIVHTGGTTMGAPSLVEPVAKKYPDVTFVLNHAGWLHWYSDAENVARNCQNVVLETSWSAIYDIGSAIATLGADRVMLGTDFPINMATEVAKYKSLGLPPDKERMVMGETAAKVHKIVL